MARGGGRSFSRMPRGRGRGATRGATRSRGRSLRGNSNTSRSTYTGSRVQELEDTSAVESNLEEASDIQSDSTPPSSESDSEHEVPVAQPYANLLQALSSNKIVDEPPRKKRKTALNTHMSGGSVADATSERNHEQDYTDVAAEEAVDAGLSEAVEEDDKNDMDQKHNEMDSDEEEFILHDPFETHYCRMQETMLQDAIGAVTKRERNLQNVSINNNIKKTTIRYREEARTKSIKTASDLHLKHRLLDTGAEVIKKLSPEEKDVAAEIFNYRDIQYGSRQVGNSARLRDITSLHTLNHVFKTRDRILKNNMKASQQEAASLDLRDQGYTRPKVLFIVPTKQSCATFVESIAQISQPDQQENKSRFLETFSSEDDESWLNKPEDFRELFGGNHEEDFRVGLKFTRKTIKYFSGFYNSDIIFSSALGLMRTITTGGGSSKTSKDGPKKSHDSDFLSSIEVVVVDHATAILMQNWQHLEYIFDNLNLLPKDSHGCDFSRVRNWYLEGHAKHLRQTIVFASHHTPEINSLFSQHAVNINGIAKYTPTYTGAMLNLPLTLPITPIQTFLRIDSNNSIKTPTSMPETDSQIRFQYFTTTILPQLIRSSSSKNNTKGGTLILIPTYADFTLLRNHLSTSSQTTSLSFGSISEYTPVRHVARARSHFISGRHAVLLYTERAHHHFRYRLKGVKRILFYGVPENPLFWSEIVGFLAESGGPARRSVNGVKTEDGENDDTAITGTTDSSSTSVIANLKAKGVIRALFSKWDALKLERIVGSERVGRLIGGKHGGGGDVFEFV